MPGPAVSDLVLRTAPARAHSRRQIHLPEPVGHPGLLGPRGGGRYFEMEKKVSFIWESSGGCILKQGATRWPPRTTPSGRCWQRGEVRKIIFAAYFMRKTQKFFLNNPRGPCSPLTPAPASTSPRWRPSRDTRRTRWSMRDSKTDICVFGKIFAVQISKCDPREELKMNIALDGCAGFVLGESPGLWTVAVRSWKFFKFFFVFRAGPQGVRGNWGIQEQVCQQTPAQVLINTPTKPEDSDRIAIGQVLQARHPALPVPGAGAGVPPPGHCGLRAQGSGPDREAQGAPQGPAGGRQVPILRADVRPQALQAGHPGMGHDARVGGGGGIGGGGGDVRAGAGFNPKHVLSKL